MLGKMKAEREVSAVNTKLSKSVGWTYEKNICCKTRTRCDTTTYYVLSNKADHSSSN